MRLAGGWSNVAVKLRVIVGETATATVSHGGPAKERLTVTVAVAITMRLTDTVRSHLWEFSLG